MPETGQQLTRTNTEGTRRQSASADLSSEVYRLLAEDHPTQDQFRTLLERVSAGVLAKRFLHTGLPYVFKGQPHKYLAFREAVGRIFAVAPQDIAVMGSARFGFSTNPGNYSSGKAKALDQDSDMDMVIVCRASFQSALGSFADYVWLQLRNIKDLTSEPSNDKEETKLNKNTLIAFRRRSKGFNFGYVNPADLQDSTPEKQRFYDMKREAGTQLFGTAPPGPIHRVGAWIYRDWDAAERMYEFSFRQLAKAWGVDMTEDSGMPGDLDQAQE